MRGVLLAAVALAPLLLAGCGSGPSGSSESAAPPTADPAGNLTAEAAPAPPMVELDGPLRMRLDGAGLRVLHVRSAEPFRLAGGAWAGNDTVPAAERQTLIVLRPLGVPLDGPCHPAPATLLAWHTSFGALDWAGIPAGAYAVQAWASAGGSVLLDAGAPDADAEPQEVAALGLGDILPVAPYVAQTSGADAEASFEEPVPAAAAALFFGRFDSAPTMAGPDSSATTGLLDSTGRTCDEAAMVAIAGAPTSMALDVRAVVAPGNHTWAGSSHVTMRTQAPARAFGFLVPLAGADAGP